MDEDGRSFTEAEVKFFSQCDTGSIVVIVLFTKFDALYDDEFAELICKGVSRKDAQALAAQHAKEAFADGPQLKLLYNRKGNHRRPRCHICLPDMDKDNADCRPLIELTAETLDNDTLKRMFVSTQRTTLELCMRYAVESVSRSLAQHLDTTQAMTSRIFGKSDREILNDLGKWFPHTTEWWWNWRDNWDNNARDANDDMLNLNMAWAYMDVYHPEDEEMWSALRHLPPESSTLGQIMQFSSAALIVFENAFYLVDEQQGRMSVRPVCVALQQYMASPNAAAVRAALSPAIHTYEAGFSRWIPGSAKHSQKKADLINTITEVVLQHRLPIPGVQSI
jgi:hypothetical protein